MDGPAVCGCKGRTMKRFVILAALAFSIAGCARVDIGPSYLGLPVVSGAEAEDTVAEGKPLPELRHVTSNKVLGAMAYQKVTGRTIDPSRLQGTR